MSSSTSTIRISATDPTAEIKVLDASANIVAHDIGALEEPLSDGLYKIRVRVGSEFEERLVSLDPDLEEQTFGRLKVPSPIPIDGTGQSHEYHQDAIKYAWEHPAAARGAGSRLLISAREWSPDQSRSHPDPAGSVSVRIPSGECIDFAAIANVRQKGDACAVGVVDVDPGYCSIEVALSDGSRLRRALYLSGDWSTQLYMLFTDSAGQRLPNLAGGSVAIAHSPVVHDEETRLAEIALDALTQHRAFLSEHMRILLNGKFERPLLGIIGAHLLLHDGGPDHFFGIVVQNLTQMLGADHPDVMALRTKLNGPLDPVSEPPLLRASWDLLVEASATRPDLFVPGSRAAKVAECVVPAGAWFMWQTPGSEDAKTGLEAKLDVVRAYMDAQAQAQGSSRPPRDIGSAGFESFGLTEPPAALGEAARSDLSRALGVPRMTLNSLLRRL